MNLAHNPFLRVLGFMGPRSKALAHQRVGNEFRERRNLLVLRLPRAAILTHGMVSIEGGSRVMSFELKFIYREQISSFAKSRQKSHAWEGGEAPGHARASDGDLLLGVLCSSMIPLLFVLVLMVLLVLLIRSTIILIWLLLRLAVQLVVLIAHVVLLIVVAVVISVRWVSGVSREREREQRIEILPPAKVTKV